MQLLPTLLEEKERCERVMLEEEELLQGWCYLTGNPPHRW